MNYNPIVRKCQQNDLESLKQIYKEFYLFHEKRGFVLKKLHIAPDLFADYVLENLNNDKSHILVVECKGAVVGYCFARILEKPPVYIDSEYGEIDSMAILEEYQRKGLGEKLFKEALEWFKSRNIRFIETGVALSNEKSSSFWSKMGFKQHMAIKLMEIKRNG